MRANGAFRWAGHVPSVTPFCSLGLSSFRSQYCLMTVAGELALQPLCFKGFMSEIYQKLSFKGQVLFFSAVVVLVVEFSSKSQCMRNAVDVIKNGKSCTRMFIRWQHGLPKVFVTLLSNKDLQGPTTCWNSSINFNSSFLFRATAAIYIKFFQSFSEFLQCLLVPWEIYFF